LRKHGPSPELLSDAPQDCRSTGIRVPGAIVVAQRLDPVVGSKKMVEDILLLKVLASNSDMVATGQVVVLVSHAGGFAKGPMHVTAHWHAKEAEEEKEGTGGSLLGGRFTSRSADKANPWTGQFAFFSSFASSQGSSRQWSSAVRAGIRPMASAVPPLSLCWSPLSLETHLVQQGRFLDLGRLLTTLGRRRTFY